MIIKIFINTKKKLNGIYHFYIFIYLKKLNKFKNTEKNFFYLYLIFFKILVLLFPFCLFLFFFLLLFIYFIVNFNTLIFYQNLKV